MFRRDLFHDAVLHGLEKENWRITDDPYYILFGGQKLQIDIAANMPVAAEREGRKIAVEIKSFAGKVSMVDFYAAIGQFVTYRNALRHQEPERKLFLAVPVETFEALFNPAHGRDLREELGISLLVYNPGTEAVTKWIE